MQKADIIIVGAGAAGVGMGTLLKKSGCKDFVILERKEVGASFKRWPKEMRFISPSFDGNAFGVSDLNAVTPDISPAYVLGSEHPTGKEYGRYLQRVTDVHSLPVECGVDIQALDQNKRGFSLRTSQGKWQARIVLWAAGEFQYPNLSPFPGADLCLHNTRVRTWDNMKGKNRIVIGGYESGADAAFHLSKRGIEVTVVDAASSIECGDIDASISLSPFTRDRLEDVQRKTEIQWIKGKRVTQVTSEGSMYIVQLDDGQSLQSAEKPILATGFCGSTRSLIEQHFEWSDEGVALLTDRDESTICPGLFLLGSQVRHGDAIFCFIYKFRQRWPSVARATCNRWRRYRIPKEYGAPGWRIDDVKKCCWNCAC